MVALTLTGAGCLVLTQVSVGGSYLGDIFFGLLILRPGLGATYVAASVATLLQGRRRAKVLGSRNRLQRAPFRALPSLRHGHDCPVIVR